jgi:hypothetical protein
MYGRSSTAAINLVRAFKASGRNMLGSNPGDSMELAWKSDKKLKLSLQRTVEEHRTVRPQCVYIF